MSYSSSVSSRYSLPRSSTSYAYSTKPSSVASRGLYEPRNDRHSELSELSNTDFDRPSMARRSKTYDPGYAYSSASSVSSRRASEMLYDHNHERLSTLSDDTIRPEESISQVSSYASRGRSRGSSRGSSAEKQMMLYRPDRGPASEVSVGSSMSRWNGAEQPYWDAVNQCTVRNVEPRWLRTGL